MVARLPDLENEADNRVHVLKRQIHGLLFLIGINVTGFVVEKISKEQKQDLMHVAVCTVLSSSGYYSLDVIDEGGPNLFIVFADQTSGVSTYGAGRFVEIPKPDSEGNTEIDFNKAYNPPCAFTAFATCPLPPKQNRLSLKIEAGEKNYGHH